MKRIIATLIALGLSLSALAQIRYVDARTLDIRGKITYDNCADYERIPASLLAGSRESLQWLGSCSSGLYVRFRTNSRTIYARWSSKWDSRMNHMTDTGVRGVDLYVREGKKWVFVAAGRPGEKSPTDSWMLSDMTPKFREYMLYLPLYESATSVEIGVDVDAEILPAELESPSTDRQIVMYGTSILQGGCASRPGMAYTNILSRMLDTEVVNLGFSGNALLDYEIARHMAAAGNPAVFVLDFCPNATIEDINEKGEEFIRILREAHPDVPLVFVDDMHYASYGFNPGLTFGVDNKNKTLAEFCDKLRAKGEKKIIQVAGSAVIGYDNEATVDGTHFTDLGMMRYAEYMAPILKKLLK